MLEARLSERAVLQPELEEPLAGERLHRAGAQVHAAERAGLAVGDVEHPAVGRESGRLGEGGVGERAVVEPLPSAAGAR